jgi:CDP-4-dehydro-6-deoxyglucose reductase, E3
MQRAMQLPETLTVKLVKARHVTPRVRELTFERVDGRFFLFEAGQWVSVAFPLLDAKGRTLRRSYSIASVPNDSPRFELVVTRVDEGRGSTFLHEAPEGTELEVRGPQGVFTRELDPPHASLFIATGTGIAPFRGMVHEALRAKQAEPLWVLFGVRSLGDALYREELEALAHAHPNLKLMLSLSRPDPSWHGLTGYVQTHVKQLWTELHTNRAPGQVQAYVCGVRKMLNEVRGVLRTELGVDRDVVHLESYD